MKRLFLLAAAASLVAFAPSGDALARDHGRGHEGGWAQRGGGEHRGGGGPRGGWDGARPRHDGPRHERRHGPDRDERWRYEDRRRGGPDGPPRAYRSAPRRGGYLPEGYRGGVVDDFRAYRLRPPPRGFAWVRVGSGFALVDMSDGRIYDMVQ
jgi:Ni/Co efflux regulator RcnB